MTRLPLEGVRIIAMPVVFAGPFAVMLLGDLGAEVILVESIHHFPRATRGGMARPPQIVVPTTLGKQAQAGGGATGGFSTYVDHVAGERPWDRVVMFNAGGRNKLSCCIDLTRPQGREVFHRLVKVSDVFLESLSPATAEKHGLGYDVLQGVKPDIIYLSMPAVGNSGPYKYCALFGQQLQALAGYIWLMGYPDLDYTTTQAMLIPCDAASGATAAFAVICALHYRERTRKGQYIDLAQIEAFIPHLGEAIMDYTMNRRVQEPVGNRHPSMAPHGVYRCYGEDRWVVLSVSSEEEWQGLCRALGSPPWCREERFSTMAGRLENQDELDRYIEE